MDLKANTTAHVEEILRNALSGVKQALLDSVEANLVNKEGANSHLAENGPLAHQLTDKLSAQLLERVADQVTHSVIGKVDHRFPEKREFDYFETADTPIGERSENGTAMDSYCDEYADRDTKEGGIKID